MFIFKKRLEKIESKIEYLLSVVKTLDDKVKDVELIERDKQGSFSAIVDEWLNGKEGG